MIVIVTYVKSKLPQAGPLCGSVRMAMLMYADDIQLMIYSCVGQLRSGVATVVGLHGKNGATSMD